MKTKLTIQKATNAQISKSFERWLSAYQKNPEKFNDLKSLDLVSYGEGCVMALTKYLR